MDGAPLKKSVLGSKRKEELKLFKTGNCEL